MKMNEYDVLEECLEALESGQTVDAILAHYPDQARELRPLLNTAIRAKLLGEIPVPVQFQKRDRNRLIRRAAEMRESKRVSRRMIPLFPRLVVTLGVVGALVLSSTGLVSASANSIPGDQLYPVKRTWEDVRLMFVFTPQGKDILQSQYQQERLNEVGTLLNTGRSTPITFSGLVTHQQDDSWTISGIPVSVNGSTILPSNAITASAPVIVTGITRSDGTVEAEQIQLLAPGAPLPPFEPSENSEESGHSNSSPSTPVTQVVPMVGGTSSPETQSTSPSGPRNPPTSYEFSGIVDSMQNGIWTINGQTVHVDQAAINGNVQIGSAVKFQGYYDANGTFVVSNLVVTSNDSGWSSGHHNNSNNGGSGNGSPTQGSGDNENGGGGESSGGGEGGGSGSGGIGTPTGGDH